MTAPVPDLAPQVMSRTPFEPLRGDRIARRPDPSRRSGWSLSEPARTITEAIAYAHSRAVQRGVRQTVRRSTHKAGSTRVVFYVQDVR